MKIIMLLLMAVLSVALIVVLQFGFIFLILALMPAIVAYYIDRDPRKNSFKLVFASNFGAALPTLIPMIKSGLKMKSFDTVALFHEPSTWLFIYLGAAAGWCLFFLCRYLAGVIVTLTTQSKISALQQEQKLLLEEWGQGIMLEKQAQKRAS